MRSSRCGDEVLKYVAGSQERVCVAETPAGNRAPCFRASEKAVAFIERVELNELNQRLIGVRELLYITGELLEGIGRLAIARVA